MLFRLGMLTVFTVLAGVLAVTSDSSLQGRKALPVWVTLVVGYGATIAYARLLPRARDLTVIAWIQTGIDIGLSAAAVQFTGGLESGLVLLYLISVLGAATMGGRRLAWAAAATSAAVYVSASALEVGEMLRPSTLSGDYLPPNTADAAIIVVRSMAALVGVALLSSYLAGQLQSSVSQVGNLRALNENIVRSLSSGLLTVDRDGRLLYFNPVARQILELRDEQIGGQLLAILPGIVSGSRTAGRIDIQHIAPSGRALHIGLTRTPLRDADGLPIGEVINFQDVTRLHDLAQRVRRNERLAAVGELAASVAHEIRNPLAAISGSAELLVGGAANDEDRRLLAIIRRESARLSDMVSDLLAFTRPRHPEPIRVDLDRGVRETTEAFAADPTNVGITVVFDGDPGVEVEVDPVQLGQVMWNLLRNAAEAMDGRGRIRVEVAADEDEALILIRDDGRGIPPDRIDTVFDPFFTTKPHGTGFGLAIVHRIVGDNGGRIAIESELGRGTVVTIAFPRAQHLSEASSSGQLMMD